MVASFFNSYSLFQIDMGFLVLFHTFQAQLALRQMQKEADGEYEDPDRQYLEDDEEPRKKGKGRGRGRGGKGRGRGRGKSKPASHGAAKVDLAPGSTADIAGEVEPAVAVEDADNNTGDKTETEPENPPKRAKTESKAKKKEEGNASKKRVRTKSPSAKEAETTKKLAMESKEIQETKNVEDCIEAVVNPI